MNDFSGSQETADERLTAAQTFHRATYGRFQHRDGLHLPLWRGKDLPTIWLDPSDEEGFVSAVTSQEGGSVYTPVRLRAVKSEKPSGYGTADELAPFAEMVFIDWDTQAGGKADGSDGELAYAANREVLRGLMVSFHDEYKLPIHAEVETPNGIHTYTLTEPLGAELAAEVSHRVQAAYIKHLADRGYRIDENVTVTPTRVGRAPGAFHSKHIGGTDESTPLTLVTVTSTDPAPPVTYEHLDAVLPKVLPLQRAATPVVDESLLGDREKFARRFPVTSLLPALGWQPNPHRRGSWTSPMEGGSVDAAGVEWSEKSEAEIIIVRSARAATEFGPVMTSADAIAYATGRDYRLSRQVWRRILGDETDESFVAARALVERKATRDEWERFASAADAGWPEDLTRAAQERLAFRGVRADVATARGYASPDTHEVVKPAEGDLVDWILAMPAVALSGAHVVTAQARVRTDPNAPTPKREGPGRPRKDEGALVDEVRGFGPAGSGLFVNPLAKDRAKADCPLIIVTQDDPLVREPWVPGLGQVQADAVLSAALREDLDVAVVHAGSWASLMIAPGAPGNPTHAPQPHKSFAHVKLSERDVYLVSRCTWRHDRGLTQVIDLLAARGANVHVLDVPRPDPVAPAVVATDRSTRSVGDWLAANVGSDPLRRLLDGALPAEVAARQAHVPDDTATAEMADLVVQELERTGVARYDAVSKVWCRDRVTHMQVGGAGTAMNFLVRRILWDHGVLVQSAKVLQDVVSACERDERIQVATSDFDQNKRELVALNGIINLETGELRPRPCGYLNSRVVPVNYAKNAQAPAWLAFMSEVTLGDEALVTYLKRAAGLTAIGEVIEEIMFFHVGIGRNGKSTWLNVLAFVLGEFATTVPVEWLETKPTPFQKGDLRGVRMALAPEPRQGMRLNDASLKALVSRDPMSGERKFGSSFNFNPSHTIHSAVNHVPLIRDRTEGSRRRFQVVPWRLNVSDEDADRGLEARLKGEAAGVLAWLVQGAVEVLAAVRASEKGAKLPAGLLEVPEVVKDRTASNWDDNDMITQWMRDHDNIAIDLTTDADNKPLYKASKKQVHDAFNDWLEDNDEKRWSPRTIESQLASKGVVAKREADGRYYVGITFDAKPVVDEPVPIDEPLTPPVVSEPVPPQEFASLGLATVGAGEVEL